MKQIIIDEQNNFSILRKLLLAKGIKNTFVVCDNLTASIPVLDVVKSLQIPSVRFSKFMPNPLYEDIEEGLKLFKSENCDAIIAIGGGSSIDVAKCIKMYSGTGIPLVAIPTTAGTGSESTCFAVMYRNGEKQSVEHESILPNIVLLEPSTLNTLPIYQRKCTLLDALCQGVESWWSINSTDESKAYSQMAVSGLVKDMFVYLNGYNSVNGEIMRAANYSGRAINITRTTTPHAMSYKLTSLYKIPHGHAVAICLPKVWIYMLENRENCNDIRGWDYLSDIFMQISKTLGKNTPTEAITWFEELLTELDIKAPSISNLADIELLKNSVNPQRLKNNPITIDADTFEKLYTDILN